MSEKVYLFLVCTSMPTKIVGNAAGSYISILKVFNAAFPTILSQASLIILRQMNTIFRCSSYVRICFSPTIKCFLNSKTSYRNWLNSNNKLWRSHAPEDRGLIEHRWKDECVGDRE